MTEERLLEGSATELEAALLNSATAESPSADLSAKMMAPLTPGAATGAATAGSIMKWGIGTAGVALAIGATILLGGPSNDSAPTDTTAQAPLEPRRQLQPPPTIPAEDEPSKESEAVKVAAEKTAPRPQSSATPSGTTSTLAAEMKLLDQARSALRSGDSKKALRLLSTYEARYPRGTLRPESTVLRVQALKDSGARGRASELQDKFLRTHPQSAHKKQLEERKPSSP